jgi:methyl-CpG-binding domain protein 4
VERIIKPLGLQKRRSCGIIRMSLAYVKGAWRQPGDLPGIGKYASDAYSLFVTGTWKQDTRLEARPTDYALLLYRSYLDSLEKGSGANGEITGEVCMDRAGDTIL